MHDNAIHDLALPYWSGLLSPIKRPCCQNERSETGKLLRLVHDLLGRKAPACITYLVSSSLVPIVLD